MYQISEGGQTIENITGFTTPASLGAEFQGPETFETRMLTRGMVGFRSGSPTAHWSYDPNPNPNPNPTLTL